MSPFLLLACVHAPTVLVTCTNENGERVYYGTCEADKVQVINQRFTCLPDGPTVYAPGGCRIGEIQ